jgi:predicted DNA-binding protein
MCTVATAFRRGYKLHWFAMAIAKRKRARLGRPPLGADGQKVSDYPQVMIRLPRDTKATLDALSALTGTPIWRLIDQAVNAFVKHMPPDQRRLLDGVRSRRSETKRPTH